MVDEPQALKEDSKNVQNEGDLASPKAKGERLRRIRHLANLSREQFCEDGDVNLTTLVSWEIGRFGGLSLKGAKRVVSRVAKEGVFCTPEWLLYEIGSGPQLRSDYKKNNQKSIVSYSEKSESCEQENIINELMLFRKLNSHSVDCIIEDDGMHPHYRIGDYVAGTKRYAAKLESLIGLDCIIQTKDGRLVMRSLQKGPQSDTFNLVCTNLQATVKETIIYNVEIVSAAPVLWHRRFEP